MSKLTKTIKNLSIIIYRSMKLLLKRQRNIEIINCDYFKSWRAEQSYLILNIDFKNVIYYEINQIKYFNLKSHIYLNLKKIKTNNLKLVVYGFYQKEIITIELDKDLEFNSNQFQTNISHLNFEVYDHHEILLLSNLINLNSPTVKFKNTKTRINTVPIELNFNQYNIENYL